MKAAFIESFSGTSGVRVGEFPDPIPTAGDVVLRMTAASLNHHDVYTTRGEAGRYTLPLVLGNDGVGVVRQAPTGGVRTVGERVAVYPVMHCGHCMHCRQGWEHKCFSFGMMGGEHQGTLAEYVALPERNCVSVPTALADRLVGSLAVAGLTAWNMIYDEGAIQPGEHVLVVGASGGVGVYAIRLLKQLGAVVLAVTSRPEKVEFLRALGADQVVVGSAASVLVATGKLPLKGVDAAINYVGGATWRYVLPAVRRAGRILTCGSVAGPMAELDQRQIFYRQLRILGCTMGSLAAFRRLLDFFAVHPELEVPLADEGPLELVPQALQRMEQGSLSGKIVIHP
jgi:NADPH:quinone reductase-like Zn-dependent oxidoreductase